MKTLVEFLNEAREFSLDSYLTKHYKKSDDFIYSAKVTYEPSGKTETLGDLWWWKIDEDNYIYAIFNFARNLYAIGNPPDGKNVTLRNCFNGSKYDLGVQVDKEVDEYFKQSGISMITSPQSFKKIVLDRYINNK